jgi:hypothetical protein
VPGKLWEEWEDKVLANLWPIRQEALVMVITGRSIYAIKMRARIMHLRRRNSEPVVHTNAMSAATFGASWEPTKCCTPTDAPIGSTEKVNTLRMRLMNGEPLWHENDNRCAVHHNGQDMDL